MGLSQLPPPSPPLFLATTQPLSHQLHHTNPLERRQPPPPPLLFSPTTTPFPTPKPHANLRRRDGPPSAGDCPHKTHRLNHIPRSPQRAAAPCLTRRDHPPPSGDENPQWTPPRTLIAGHSPYARRSVLLWRHVTGSSGTRPLLGCSHIWSMVPTLNLETFSMEYATGMVAFEEGGHVTGRIE